MTTESTISSKQSQVVGGFASLLSSALNVSGSAVNQPLQSSADKLPVLISSSQEGVCCTVPSLQIRKKDSAFFPLSSKPILEEAASSNLRHPLEMTRKQLSGLPITLLWNISKSFMSLVDSRLSSSLAALVRQSGQDNELSRVLVGLLSHPSNPIVPTAVVTTFRTLAFSERTEEGIYVIPLIFEAVIDLNILQGHLIAAHIEAPGTIQGRFSCSSEQAGPVELLRVDVSMDTSALLQSMMTQARIAVRRAVGLATETARELVQHQTRRVVSSGNLKSAAAIAPVGASLPSLNLDSIKIGPVPELLQQDSDKGDRDTTSSVAKAENPLMLPPPARAPTYGAFGGDQAAVAPSTQSSEQNSTRTTIDPSASGLSLLTAALGGLKRKCSDEGLQDTKLRRKGGPGSKCSPREQNTEERTKQEEQEEKSSKSGDDAPSLTAAV